MQQMGKIDMAEKAKLQGKYYMLDQKFSALQCIFCCFCEASNEYKISECDPNFNANRIKGTIKEESECLNRALCVCNRPFTAFLEVYNKKIAFAQRPCRCCLEYIPCQMNQIVISNKEEDGRQLGILRVPCRCFNGYRYSCADAQIEVVSGQNDEIIYSIEGNYCQKSLCIPCCRKCYCPNIDYTILDKTNVKVGKISNIYNGCFMELFSRTDKFGIQFPAKASDIDKILLMYAVVYLDYLRYETPYFCFGIR